VKPLLARPQPPLGYHPIVFLPAGVTFVLDLRKKWTPPPTGWSVGRYGEQRGVYTQALFQGDGEPRSVHLGMDLGGPVGVAVHAFAAGRVVYADERHDDGDYGHAVVCYHELPGHNAACYVLLGHLSAASLAHSPVGRTFEAGEVLGWLGDESENGGWPPHVHVQLSWTDPGEADMPGACKPSEAWRMKALHPDPALIVGALSV